MNFLKRLRVEFKSLLKDTQRSVNQNDLLIQQQEEMRHTLNSVQERLAYVEQRTVEIGNKYTVMNQTINMHCRDGIEVVGRRLRVIFLIHNLNAWYALADVIDKFRQHEFCEVTVVSINKKFPGQHDFGGEEKVHDFLESIHIPHIRLNMQDSFQGLEILKALSPDVLFRQSQWDNDYPPAFSSEYLNFTRIAFVSYEICNIIQNVPLGDGVQDNATDSFFHRRCWRIYVANEHVINAASKGALQAQQYRLAGHPKVDYIENVREQWPFNHQKNIRILWSSHHSITNVWSNFGCFHLVWKEMLAWFQERPDIDFVFCPHPALMTMLSSDGLERDVPGLTLNDVDYFFKEINKLNNVYQYYSWDYMGLVKSVDIVVTDGISLLMEPQIIGKPIVFLERSDHRPFNANGEIFLRGVHRVSDMALLKIKIAELLSKGDPLALQQKQNVEEAFPLKDAAQYIFDDIVSSLM